MYEVTTINGRALLRTTSESDALYKAIQHVMDWGEYTVVEFGDPDSAIGMHEVWRVEGDEKVDDGDPWFPAIVHAGSLQHSAREVSA